MKKLHKANLFGLALIGFVAIGSASGFTLPGNEEVPYPEGYRSWTHVKSALIEKGN